MRQLLFACWLIVGSAVGAEAAGFDAAKFAQIEQATEAFVALGKDAYRDGNPPRQTDPAVRKLLDVIFDTAVFNGSPPLTDTQLLQVKDWLVDIRKVGTVYLTAGTDIADVNKVTSLSIAQQHTIDRNVIAFAAEIGRFFDATLAVSQVMIDWMSVEVASHPDDFKAGSQAQGLARMQLGIFETLSGFLPNFQLSGVDPDWLNSRLLALNGIAPSAAKFLTAEQKKQLYDQIARISAAMTDARLRSGLTTFMQAFSAT